jgi:DNA-binding CsgD family transcriptional regulator
MPLGAAWPLHMSDMSVIHEEQASDGPLRALLGLVLAATIVGGAIDLRLDAPDTVWSAHALYELTLTAAAIATSVILWRGWWRSRRMLAETRHALEAHASERAAWRASAEDALAGFARAVDERFEAWVLTPTEGEIALRLLKGHSHKQIAFETGRSERTVRQHAVAVYQKSGLRGRAELAAFFLDDLLLAPKGSGIGHTPPAAESPTVASCIPVPTT